MRRARIGAGGGFVVLLAMVLLVACGGSGDSSSSSSSSAAPTSSSAASAGHTSTGAVASPPGHVLPIPTFALPAKGQGCGGAGSAGAGARRIPVKVSKVGPDVGIIVDACVDGKGPFPFQVDTGASSAAITTALADRLKLPKVGKPENIAGAGCSATAQERKIDSWTVGGVPLHSQTITPSTLPHFGGPGQPDGLVGSDVWSAFGAIRIDFRHQEIVVPGAEGPFPTKETLINKPSSAPLPGGLVHGHPQIVAPMKVDSAPQQTLVFTSISFGSHAKQDFTPDTGASTSAVDASVAKQARLALTHVRAKENTACSVVTAPKVVSGPWSLAGHALHPQSLVTARLLTSGPAAGLLGSDQMSRFGSVVFDYRGGRLVLGAG